MAAGRRAPADNCQKMLLSVLFQVLIFLQGMPHPMVDEVGE